MLHYIMADAAQYELADTAKTAAADDNQVTAVLIRILQNDFSRRTLDHLHLAVNA